MKFSVRGSGAVILSNIAILVVLFLAIEGLARLVLRAEDDPEAGALERKHGRFDEMLGWTHVPGAEVRNMYGSGAHLTITARGFRGTEDFEDDVPAGLTRVVCSGDSFTLGYGVADAQTWCAQLGLDPDFETVNMGQGGYGIDQMYLWYSRDATFEHDIVLFTVITDDFQRALTSRFLVYDKPVLGLSGDSVAPLNVPIRDCSFEATSCDRRGAGVARLLDRLAMKRVVDRLVRKLNWIINKDREPPPPTAEETEILRRVLRSMSRETERRGATLVTVLLPKVEDYAHDKANRWRTLMSEEAEAGGWEFWDLTESLRNLDAAEAERLYRDIDWHYTPEGNRWVADDLAVRLRLLLEATASGRSPE